MGSTSPLKDGSVAQETENTSASHSLVQQAGDDLSGAQSSGSLFGPVLPQAPGLFINDASQSSVGSLFGDASQSSGSVFNGCSFPAPESNGLFSNQPPQTNTLGSLFSAGPLTSSKISGASLQAGGNSSGAFRVAESQDGAQPSSVGSLFGVASQSSGSVFNDSPLPPYQGSGLFSSSPPHTNSIGSLFGATPHTTSTLFGAAQQTGGASSGTFKFAESSSLVPQSSVGSLFGIAPQSTGSLFTASPSPPFTFAESQDPVSMSLNLTVKLGSTGANTQVVATGSWDVRQLISHVEKELSTGIRVTKIVSGIFQVPLLPENAKLTALGVHDGDVLDALLVEEKIYEVQLLGGSSFEVKLLADDRVKNLREQIRLSGQVGAFFSLVAENAHVLSDETAPLPAGTSINVIQEDPSSVCDAAQQILRNLPADIEGRGTSHQLKSLCLGKCCQLGKFPTSEWKDCPYADEIVEYSPNRGLYHVLEFTLIDGDNKLCSMVGVINEGDADCNTGFWGIVYLRPGFSEVANLTSSGSDESSWKVMDSLWYKDPAPELPRCKDTLSGGKRAASPLETHLSHALAVAYFGKSAT